MPADALDEILNGFKRLTAATARVEFETDPSVPGRTAYRITGPTRGVVQAAIDTRMLEVEERGGFAQFLNPGRVAGGFQSLGEIIIPQKQAAA